MSNGETSVLLLIDLLNRTDHRKEVVLTIMAVTHCMAAAAILFARLPFRLLLPLSRAVGSFRFVPLPLEENCK